MYAKVSLFVFNTFTDMFSAAEKRQDRKGF